ncbi:unnamed protein product [Protopolystoma xenopodis]|uniref:Uncharacterized protein n=1 Tax=Protopolystoma xenopodis TaxID=117903 RepID=A0A448WQ41_9PLAT|nr:unnamed protein product [Protopolystoma xenopodis]
MLPRSDDVRHLFTGIDKWMPKATFIRLDYNIFFKDLFDAAHLFSFELVRAKKRQEKRRTGDTNTPSKSYSTVSSRDIPFLTKHDGSSAQDLSRTIPDYPSGFTLLQHRANLDLAKPKSENAIEIIGRFCRSFISAMVCPKVPCQHWPESKKILAPDTIEREDEIYMLANGIPFTGTIKVGTPIDESVLKEM